MKKLFGTDGIRAVAGVYPLDRPTIRILGKALVGLLREEGLPPEVLIGRDTRESGEWIEADLVRGIADAGGAHHSAGVIPTSGVSHLTLTRAFSAGVVISASHNPYRDNGIKIFSSKGMKISDAWEARLEKSIFAQAGLTPPPDERPPAPESRLLEDYEKFLVDRFEGVRLPRRFKVVLDCGQGACSGIAPVVYRAIGVEPVALNAAPDGRNINAGCGSLHPQGMAETVVREGADFGVSFDGDADRALWADEKGRLLNGDHTLHILSRFLAGRGRLKAGAVVATTMSNMGLEKALGEAGLRLVRTQVGDKYVLEKMIELGANLGGERSGHTILLDDCPTGDGILTSLKILEAMALTGKTLSALAEGYTEFPQVLLSVRVARKTPLAGVPEVAAAIENARAGLAGRGRLDVRYSGTEPLLRIMVEGEDQAEIDGHARCIAAAAAAHLG
ncbi:MAG: phosphoglucosamine mutase [Candidatus Aminicenantales bacterium]